MFNGAANTGRWYANGSLALSTTSVTTADQRDFIFDSGAGVLRIGRVGVNIPNLYWTGSALQLRQNTTTMIELSSDGKAYFQKEIWLGSTGGIYQGDSTFASPGTGLKIWNASGIGRIAGYTAGVEQWGAQTTGKLTAGGGNVVLDANGIALNSSSVWTDYGTYGFRYSGALFGGVGAFYNPASAGNVRLYSNPSLQNAIAAVDAQVTNNTYRAVATLNASGVSNGATLSLIGGDWSQATLNIDSAYIFDATPTAIAFGVPLDTRTGVALTLKQDSTTVFATAKTSADAYIKLGNGRTADGNAFLDLIGDTTNTSYGTRLYRSTGVNGAFQILHAGTGILRISAQDAADMQFRTGATERLLITSAGLAKFASSVAVGGDYGGTASYVTITNATQGIGSANGTIKVNGTTSRNSTGWLKIYNGTTAVYVPYFDTVTG
jgi:hypothetical protein